MSGDAGLLPAMPLLTPLMSISPTRFIGLKACRLREAWAAAGAAPLLPSSPAARLGTVIHRFLEDAGQGLLTDANVDQVWADLMARCEAAMADNWRERQFVPLRNCVRDYEVRRLQARSRALELSGMAASRPRRAYRDLHEFVPLHGFEVSVATADGRVRGRIDAIVLEGGAPIVRDYKSGMIFESGAPQTLKREFGVQMTMYAGLYWYSAGVWPARLEIVPTAGQPEPVEYEHAEARALIEEARGILDAVNAAIAVGGKPGEKEVRLASPGKAACPHCPYRPACAAYRSARAGQSGWPEDVWGRLMNVTELGDGGVVAELDTDGGRVLCRLMGNHRHPGIDAAARGADLAVFDLRATASATMFTDSPFTVVYGSPSAESHEVEPEGK